MNLREMKNAIQDMGRQIRAKSQELTAMAGAEKPDFGQMEKIRQEMKDLAARQQALKDSYQIEESAQAGRIGAGMQTISTGAAMTAGQKEEKTMSEIRKSNEYVRAFAFAVKNGLNRRTGRNFEQTKILYDALTEGGGATPGEDGGFLVPIDIDNQIRELRRELNPLAGYFTQETVSAPTGWRVMDTAPTTGMSLVQEMGTIAKDDQPVFAKVTYSLDKYALIVPVSNELLSDEVANLMGYLSRWFAKKQVITENTLLITALKTLSPSALGGQNVDAIAAIKSILNKSLDPAISATAKIMTNQSGFDAMDQIVDEMGRGLLQPDPTNPTVRRVFGREVIPVNDAQLPNTSNKPEFFIGDFREFATLFSKDGFEVASTDIGGSAWATDSVEVRGISRMGVTKFDTAAVVRRQLTLS